jgi:protein-disulfide isomerase
LATKKNTKKKKVDVVFEDKEKTSNNSKSHSKNKHVAFKKNANNSEHKNIKHDLHHTNQTHAHTHHAHKTKKKQNKDYLIIGILIVLIVGIVIASFLIPQKEDVIDDVPGVIDTNNDFIDTNDSIEITDQDIANFEQKSLELNLKILNDLRDYQKEILFDNFEDTELDLSEMDSCIANNNYLMQDGNMLNLEKVKSIQEDSLLSDQLFVSSTPTTFVNGYMLSGYKDENIFTNFLDLVKNSESLNLDYQDKSFVIDDNSLKLYLIYDVENTEIDSKNKEFINYLTESEVLIPELKNIFKTLFEIENTEYVQYNSEKGKSILQTIDSDTLPAYYITGDIENLDVNKDIFDMVFEKEEVNNGYKLNPMAFTQIYSGNPINGVYRLLDYQRIVQDSYFLGSQEASSSILLFTDFDCPFCKQFQEETLTDQVYQEYIDSGDYKLYIKPLLTNDVFSLFPVLFFKCSQEQDKSLMVSKKIFQLQSEISVQESYDIVSLKYQDEIEELEEEYNIIMEYMQRNYQ